MRRTILLLIVMLFLVAVSTASGAFSSYTYSMVYDYYPGIGEGDPLGKIIFNGKMYYSANNGTNGFELTEYDGVNPPTMVLDINPGVGHSDPGHFAVFNDKLYFNAYNPTFGQELWVYDGSTTPTRLSDFAGGTGSGNPKNLTVYDGKLYFQAYSATHGTEMWAYDGVTIPTAPFYNLSGGSLQPTNLIVYSGELYFQGDTGTNGWELYHTDGTTTVYEDMHTGSGSTTPREMAVFNSKLYFTGYDPTYGTELLWYDAATDSSGMVMDLRVGGSSSPAGEMVYNGKLYFTAVLPATGRELYEYNGVSNPTLVVDLNSAPADSLIEGMTEYLGKLYFSADSGPGGLGNEVWMYDGTNQPSNVTDINSNGNAYPEDFIVWNDKLYFGASDGTSVTFHGKELWVYEPVIVQELFYSQSAYDGWVLETGENTNKGGLINTSNLTCLIGDDAQNRQYRTILHFNTSRIPDSAVVSKSVLQVKEHSWVGDPPYLTLGGTWADIRHGWFSNNPGLVKSDFAAAPSMGFAGLFKLTPTPLAYPVFRATLKSDAFQYINLAGSTQFRIRYAIGDDNDNGADYAKLFCGDMPVPFNRPNLRVWYYVP